jgi:hypothetical protein
MTVILQLWEKEKEDVLGLRSFWTLFIAQYSEEHNVLETGSVSVVRSGGGRHLRCWIRQKELIPVGRCLTLPHPNTEIDPVSEAFCSLVLFRILDDGQSKKKIPSIPIVYTMFVRTV